MPPILGAYFLVNIMNFDYLYRVLLQDKVTGRTELLNEFASLKDALAYFDLFVYADQYKLMPYEDKQYFDPEIIDVAYDDKDYLVVERIQTLSPMSYYKDPYDESDYHWGKGDYDRYDKRYDPIDDYEIERWEDAYYAQIFSSVETIVARYCKPHHPKIVLADTTNMWYLGCLKSS